jgi:hypothetical protein
MGHGWQHLVVVFCPNRPCCRLHPAWSVDRHVVLLAWESQVVNLDCRVWPLVQPEPILLQLRACTDPCHTGNASCLTKPDGYSHASHSHAQPHS